ncbi:MAG: hypothetical protein ABWW69_00020 [Pyrodictiaceae archaeon]
MSRELFAIADTCFLIDWARYRRRDVLFQLFRTVFVPEQVLDEVRSENTIAWIAHWLARGALALYTPFFDEIEEARRLIEQSHVHPQLPAMDLPEALCLVVGRRRGYIVLTENRAALLAPRLLQGLENVRVWRALEILLEAVKRRILQPNCSNPRSVFDEYSEDTLHIFPSKALNRAVEEVSSLCRQR